MTRAASRLPLSKRYPPMELVIPRVPVTANAAAQMHWAARGREREAWSMEIRAQTTPGPWFYAKREDSEKLRAAVEIEVTRKRRQDPDNAVASVKRLVDALKGQGWLVDDSSAWLDLKVTEVVGKVPRTVIRWRILETVT